MRYWLRKLYRPEFYQGPRRNARYFEGWYFKVVTTQRACALIPGVSRSPDDPHAFVQFIDGSRGTASYHRYPLAAFTYDRERFRILIAGNEFSLEGLSVSLDGFSAELTFDSAIEWRGTLLQPGTMGWYSFVPFMECRHAIIVMDAGVRGTIDGEESNGRLYVEKDYGRSFPNAWIWLQTNSFAAAGTSVTCSIANVPFVGGAFTGFLAGIAVNGVVHKFTTYTGCRMEYLAVHERSVEIVLRDDTRSLTVEAVREPGAELRAPREGAMSGRVVESLRSRVNVKLSEHGRVVYEGTGTSAGLEVVNPDRLTVPVRRRR